MSRIRCRRSFAAVRVISRRPSRTDRIRLCAGFLATVINLFNPVNLSALGNDGGALPHSTQASSYALASPSSAYGSAPASVVNERAATNFRRVWGIEDIHLRSTASGALIRFSYRVTNAEKAKVLADKKFTPLAIDERTHLALQIPVMEKVGQLRQVCTLQNGREYWMAFSNKGNSVRPGSHVDIVIGKMRLEDLIVEGSTSRARWSKE